MKSQQEKQYVGIDVGKRLVQVCRITAEGRIQRMQTDTGTAGMKVLCTWLVANDVVAIEAGNLAFRIAGILKSSLGCTVHILNPGDIAMIHSSLKKTDKEDALKLARLVARFSESELPLVPIPSEDEQDARRLLKEQDYWTRQVRSAKNRLHSIFAAAGFTAITKKDVATSKRRLRAMALFGSDAALGLFRVEAERTNLHLEYLEDRTRLIEEKIRLTLRKHKDYATIALSLPGVGPVLTLAFFAYLGDCRRFSSGKQVSNYAGLVPRVDISGDIVHYGRIIKRGNRHIKRCIVQGGWAMSRSKSSGRLGTFFQRKRSEIGNGKAVIALSRKIVETFYAMMRDGTIYADSDPIALKAKLARCGITETETGD